MTELSKNSDSHLQEVNPEKDLILAMILLPFLVLAVYAAYYGPLHAQANSAESYPFLLDDFTSIVQNKQVHDAKQAELFTIPNQNLIRWWLSRPLTMKSFAKNYQQAGLSPKNFRLVNIIIHMVNSVLLFLLLWRLFRMPGFATHPYFKHYRGLNGIFFTFAIALCWAVHPICTQGVTYIVQRSESAAATGILLASLCFTFAIAPPNAIREKSSQNLAYRSAFFLMSFTFYLLAIGFKPIAIMLPAILITVYLCAIKAPLHLMRRYWPALLCATLLFVFLLIFGLYSMDMLAPASNDTKPLSAGYGAQMNPVSYLLFQPKVILHYFGLTLIPLIQSLDYGWKSLNPGWLEYFSIAGLLLLTLTAIYGLRFQSSRWISAAFYASLIYLAPTSMVPVWDICVEHRMYLPSAGVIVIIISLLELATRRLHVNDSRRLGILMCLIMLYAVTLGARTYMRNNDYRTNISLWESSLTTFQGDSRTNSRGWNNLGRLYSLRANATRDQLRHLGRQSQDADLNPAEIAKLQKKLSQYMVNSERAYRKALIYLSLDWPIDKRVAPVASTNLGIALLQMSRFGECIEILEQTVDAWPDYADAHITLGRAYMHSRQMEKAGKHFKRGLALSDESAEHLFELAQFYKFNGKMNSAIDVYKQAINKKPYVITYKLALLDTYMQLKDYESTITMLDEEIRKSPNQLSLRKFRARVQQMVDFASKNRQ